MSGKKGRFLSVFCWWEQRGPYYSQIRTVRMRVVSVGEVAGCHSNIPISWWWPQSHSHSGRQDCWSSGLSYREGQAESGGKTLKWPKPCCWWPDLKLEIWYLWLGGRREGRLVCWEPRLGDWGRVLDQQNSQSSLSIQTHHYHHQQHQQHWQY